MKVFVIEQKITAMANQYAVFSTDKAENRHEMIAFAHQKRLSFKEKFDFFTDDSREKVLFSVQARKVLDLGTRYDVRDQKGKVIGVIGKAFKASLLRSTWHIYKPGHEDKPLAIVRERSLPIAIFRRIWEILPAIGEWPFFMKYHFDFLRPSDEKLIAECNKITLFRDTYLLRIQNELQDKVDWRVPVALGVLMDALQSR